MVNGEVIKKVKQDSYLVSILTSDGRCDTEIKRRIGIAKRSFKELVNNLTNRKIHVETRKRVLKSYIWSVLTCGGETSILRTMALQTNAKSVMDG